MAEPKSNDRMEKIVSLCKRRGFIFQSSEIYGGINGFWDYGPLGAELKRNVKELWWNTMTRMREDVVGLEATIIMAPQIWRASGHVDTFSDPMCDCRVCKRRFRADQVEARSGLVFTFTGAGNDDGKWDTTSIRVLVELGKPRESAEKQAIKYYEGKGIPKPKLVGGLEHERLKDTVLFCPECGGELGEPRPFNLMFKTYVGPVESEDGIAYLRPETAQAIFAQFKNVLETSRQKVPFGIAQVGKAFRNEVTPRNFTFRSREFEQMELEFFIKPDEAVEAIHGKVGQYPVSSNQSPATPPNTEHCSLITPQPDWGWQAWHTYWVEERVRFYEGIGLSRSTLGFHIQTAEELAHYARACVDILFKFPFGTEELEGIAARGDFDLSAHQNASGKPQDVFDEEVKNAFAKWTDEQRAALVARKQAENSAKAKGALPEARITEWCERLFKGFYVPHVIEPSAGLDRLALAVIAAAFTEVEKTDAKGAKEVLTVMKFHPRIAPVKVGVFPLLKNKPELVAKAREVYDLLKPHLTAFYDEGGSIGKRYARQDEAGTPWGITIDFDTLGEKGPELKDSVTLRHRDDGSQERVAISELLGRLLPLV